MFGLVGLCQARQASLIRCGYGFGCCGCALLVCVVCVFIVVAVAVGFLIWLRLKFPFFLLMKFIFLGSYFIGYCTVFLLLAVD